MRLLSVAGFFAVGCLTFVACSGDDGDDKGGGNGGSGGSSAAGGSSGIDGDTFPAAAVTVSEVAIYQGVKRSLVVNGEAATEGGVVLVEGRDSLIRAFVQLDGSFPGGEVVGKLEIGEGSPLIARAELSSNSAEGDLATTLNFEVPGDRVVSGGKWSLEVFQTEKGGSGGKHTRYPASGTADLGVTGKKNTLRVILAPFRYNADGSGRLPNLGEPQVEKIRSRIKALYPVSDVEIRVREPHDWSQAIDSQGNGWQQVGYTLSGFRSADGESADVYYYGIFNPRETFMQYCGAGCMLGVTLLNNQPADVGEPMLRLALGIGYEEYADTTAAHELGHSHGREHVNCGPGLDPRSVDAKYPHDGKTIGLWGYDITDGTLKDPAVFSDIMGYCSRQHVSDYTFQALYDRGHRINQPRIMGEFNYDIIGVDGNGQAEFGSTLRHDVLLEGAGVSVNWSRAETNAGDPLGNGAAGSSVAVRGEFFQYDHLPGGWLLVNRDELPEGGQLEFEVDGVWYTLNR